MNPVGRRNIVHPQYQQLDGQPVGQGFDVLAGNLDFIG